MKRTNSEMKMNTSKDEIVRSVIELLIMTHKLWVKDFRCERVCPNLYQLNNQLLEASRQVLHLSYNQTKCKRQDKYSKLA